MSAFPVLGQSFEALPLLTAAHPLMETDFFQTQAGQFRGEVLGIALPHGYFWRSRWNLGGPGSAEVREDYLMVGMPTQPFRDFWHGREISEVTVATCTRELGLQHRCSRAHESLAWMIRWPRIQEVCERMGIAIPSTLGSQPIHSGPELTLCLYRRDIAEFIAHAPRDGVLSGPLAIWFEEFLIYRLMSCLTPIERGQSVQMSAGLARNICRRLRQLTHGPLVLSELCRELRLPERTLRHHFSNHYGISPQAYHQSLRLNLLSQQLLLAQPGKGRVSYWATRLGFWHMGRLGQQYRHLFGESPSQTLARQVDHQFCRFWESRYVFR